MKKILLIEDEEDLAFLFSKRIMAKGYDVRCYPKGNGAFEMIREVEPELIILDIKLPQMSGFDIYERVRSDKALQYIPIIFLSALHEEEDYCLQTLKANAFIKKPCDSSTLVEAVEKILGAGEETRQ